MKKIKSLIVMILCCAFVAPLMSNDTPIESPPPAVAFTAAEKKCLADNVYYEARGENYKGMVAVAYVTINRLTHGQYPDNICAVVKQRYKKTCQFSWVCTQNKPPNQSSEMYQQSLEVAHTVLYNYHPSKDPTKGATMFHNKDVYPIWMNTYKMTVKIKNHLFYRQPSKSNR